jgi:hypothetical protein
MSNIARFSLSSHNLRVEVGRHNHVPNCARFCTRCAAAGIRRAQQNACELAQQDAPVDDESHALGSFGAANALRMDPRFSALPFAAIRALMSCRDSQTFVHKCKCVVDERA